MNTYFFLIVLVIYLLISLSITKGDIFYPSNIIIIMYLISSFFLIGELKKWNGNLSYKGIVMLLLGITIYIVVSFITLKVFSRISIYRKNKYFNINDTLSKQSLPIVDSKITILIVVYEIWATMKYYTDVKYSSSYVGLSSSFSEMIGNYRNASAYGNLDVGISHISAYNYQIMLALAYVYAAIITQYMASKEKTTFSWKVLHALPIVIFGICSIFTGGRNPLINLGVAFIVMYFIKIRQIHKDKPMKFKTICKLVLGGVMALVAFSSFRGLVGRTSDYTTFDYLAMYIGAPLKLFDLFINGVHIAHRLVGQETFSSFLGDIGKRVERGNLEFRTSSNGIGLGNVYTPFRRYYNDFGMGGLVLLTAIQSFFYSFYYSKIRNRKNKNGIDFYTALYAYLSIGVVYYSVDERLYTYFLSWYTIKGIIFMFIFSWILPRIKLKKIKIKL